MNGTDKLYEIGYIARTHGVQGGLILKFDTAHPSDFTELEFVFVDIDGIRVPFFVLEFKVRNSNTAIVLFDDLSSEEQARELVGKPAFVDEWPYDLNDDDNEDSDDYLLAMQAFIGYEAFETKHGYLGKLARFEDIPNNELWCILRPDGSELLVPAHEDMLAKLDEEAREIHFQLPDAFLEI